MMKMSHQERSRSRLGVLAPAALSACMDASVLAVPAAGAMVNTVIQELSKAFMLKTWFHGKLSAGEAERLMMQQGRNGSFLVRESKSSPGDFVLSVRVRGRVSHVIIRKLHKKYETGSGEQFDDLSEMIEYYRAYPIVESTGDVLRLLQPLAFSRLRSGPPAVKTSESSEDSEYVQEQISMRNCDFYRQELDHLQCEIEELDYLTTNEGKKPENKYKNRYKNVLPYDQTRVILKDKHSTTEANGGEDYINANYVQLEDRENSTDSSSICSGSSSSSNKKVYIATQGCLSATEDDLYHMLWQEDVRIIVMLTKELEHRKWKCSEYWPSLEASKELECFSVKLISEDFHPYYIRRIIEVRKGEVLRTISQYHFQDWPDQRSPTEVEPVLALIEDVNQELRKLNDKGTYDKKIICVHCSAGVGRTGTFIVLDHLLSQIKEKGEGFNINIKSVVREARKQRWGLVHNLNQYMFIYKVILAYQQKMQKDANVVEN